MEIPLKKKVYSQKYRKEWETIEEFKMWLKPVVTDPMKAHCAYCRTDLQARITDLRKHAESKKHKDKCDSISTNRRIDFSAAPKPQPKTDLNALRAEGRLALFITEHTAISQIDHLTETVKKCFPDYKEAANIKMHRTKCTEVIKNVLAPHFIQTLINDIGSQKFSILLDESTDLNVSKYLGVVLRYFSPARKTVVSSFLALEPLVAADARGIVNALLKCLERHSIPLKNMIGLGCDNASVMIGINNGVHKILKTEYGLPNLVLVKCVCHSLQLAVSHASEDTLPRNIEFLIRETYNWFSTSPKRREEYKELYQLINCGENPLKILRSCATRWLSVEQAVTRILSQWDDLKLHFSLTRDKCYTSDILHAMFSDESNHLYLCYLRSILNDVQIGVKSFESEDCNPVALLSTLMTLLRSVCTRIMMPYAATTNEDFLRIRIEDHLNPAPYLGYLFETRASKSGLPVEIKNAIRKRCIDFNIKLVKEIQQRLPSNFTILEKMSQFSVENTLQQVKDNSITELAFEMGVDAETIDKLLQQWQTINFVKWHNIKNIISFWAEVLEYKNAAGINSFQELADFAISVISLPHSNAAVERIFSTMNIIKSKLRNRMNISTLNSILFIKNRLKVMNQQCYTYELPEEVIAEIGKNKKYSFKNSRKENDGTSAILPMPSTSTSSVAEGSVDGAYGIDDELFSILDGSVYF